VPAAHREPLRLLIADDEPLARDCLRLALRAHDDVEIVAECADGADAVRAIESLRPDVVFLDVQMPGLDGFGVIERVGVARMPTIVFVTAFDAHALRAFQVHALDYVLKPFDDARLEDALDRAREQVRTRRDGVRARRLAAFLAEWERRDDEPPRAPAPAAGKSYISRLTVREDDRIRFVACADIDWFEADGNYVKLYVGAKTYRLRLAIRTLIDGLDPTRFVRIHRSTVVNVDRIREVQPWYGGDYVAILHGGAKLRVSRTRAGELLRPTV
jgi:two-component system LytT family response regulator